MNIFDFNVVKMAQMSGCRAKTIPGLVRYLKYHNYDNLYYCRYKNKNFFTGARFEPTVRYTVYGKLNREELSKKHRYIAKTVLDFDLSKEASEVCRQNNRRKRAWRLAESTIYSYLHNDFTVNTFRQYGWTYARYIPHYHSCVHVYQSGKTIEYFREKKLFRRIFAPAGLTFGVDSLGAFVKSKDGTDYHLNKHDLQNKTFAKHIRAKLHEKRLSIRRQKATEKATKRYLEVKNHQMATCRVNLDDSLKSGNCLEGTLRFAEVKLKIGRENLLAGRHLTHVSGEVLLKTGDPRAKNAVERAWMRETLVSI